MASIARRFDFQLSGKGYMLVRGEYKGRAWNRTGASDSPSRRSSTDAKYGELPDELDHPEVWDDWSGGYGNAYRRGGENTYHWSENFDARYPRQLVHCQAMRDLTLTNNSKVTGGLEILDINVNIFAETPVAVGAGDIIIRTVDATERITPTGLDYSSNPWLRSASVTALPDPTGKPAVFGSYIYLGNVNGTVGGVLPFFRYNLSDLGFTYNSSLSAYGFAVAGNILWKFSGVPGRATEIQSCPPNTASGPLEPSNWTATITIGNGWSGITDMKALEDQLFVGTSEGVYAGDSAGTFVNILQEGIGKSSSDNCRDLEVFNGELVAQTVAGVYTYRAGSFESAVRRIGPPTAANRSPIQGTVRALKSHADWLYAGLWTGSQSHILAYKEGPNGYIWHTLQRLQNVAKVRRIYVDSITSSSGGLLPTYPRMWVLTEPSINTSYTAPIYFCPVPQMNGNPLAADPSFSPNYIGSARIDLGNVDWNSPSTPKSFRSVEVWADTLLSGYRYADVYYDVDQSGSFTLLGRANTSPVSTIFFPAGTGSFVSGQSIELSLRSFTASPALTPVYRSIVLRGALRPNSIDQITAVVRIADGVRDRQGGAMRNGATMLKELRDLAAQDTPTTLIDLTGAVSYVNVLPPVQESEYYQKGEDNPEVAATVKMSVMVFS